MKETRYTTRIFKSRVTVYSADSRVRDGLRVTWAARHVIGGRFVHTFIGNCDDNEDAHKDVKDDVKKDRDGENNDERGNDCGERDDCARITPRKMTIESTTARLYSVMLLMPRLSSSFRDVLKTR